MDIKNEVLYRVYILLFGIVVPLAVLLLYRTIHISYVEGEKWREKSKNLYIDYRPVEAERGNILAEDGSLLATSIPFFDIFMDPNSTGMSEEDFMENLDSLAYCIAHYVDNTFTPGGFRQFLLEQREAGVRYLPIKRKVSYSEKRFIEQFPLFNLGRMRGGFIAQKRSERKRPFGLLAQRTIGYIRDGAKPVGLEGYFDEQLGGHPGKQLMIQVDRPNDIWVPVNDLTQVEPQSGDDIITTLDINLQDITEEALLRAMNYHDAEWGTAVIMEVNTGAVRAIANLGRTSSGWWETYNHAIGSAVEPGSTFKLASIMALLEDGYVDLDDSVDIEKGETTFYDEDMVDASPYSAKLDTISVKHAFKISSNVGMAKLVTRHYGERNEMNGNQGATAFIQQLRDFNLHLPTGIEIEGEANPYIKEAYNEEDQWSGVTLPWMSIGYEVRLTPLQLLTFYNAVANHGRMVKPFLVEEIQRFGETVQKFKPTILKQRIASPKTIDRAQELLEAVVEDGTAYKLKTDDYDFAGKTGTAQINYRRGSRGTRIGGYQASFVGYFPAINPVYSCIVVVNDPNRHGIYGSDVAGPVFREIADECFKTKLKLHQPLNRSPKPVLATGELPVRDAGFKSDMEKVLQYLNIPYWGSPEEDIVILDIENDSLKLQRKSMAAEKVVPNVVNMGLRDALYVLENRGLRVEAQGVGRVVNQSIRPGTPIRGQSIRLDLGYR